VSTRSILQVFHISTFYLTTEWTKNVVLTWQFTENLNILETRYKFILHIVDSCLIILWAESFNSINVCTTDYNVFFLNTELRTLKLSGDVWVTQ
jgi:hypothetical protein